MNIPFGFQCQICKTPYDGAFILGSTNVQWDCKNCGQRNVGILDLDMTIGPQVWVKARHELTQTKDTSMSVILSATAIECELSHLFCKWTGIKELPTRGHLLTDQECEEKLLDFRCIEEKFKKVTRLLVPEGFQHFVTTTDKWRDVVSKDTPELDPTCLIKSIEENVFWPRNRILHGGTPATPEQAELCVRIAQTCLRILLAMDYERRKTLRS